MKNNYKSILTKAFSFKRKIFGAVFLLFIGIYNLNAQVTTTPWNTTSTSGAGLVDKGGKVYQLSSSDYTGKTSSSVMQTTTLYNPATQDFNVCYQAFFGCPRSNDFIGNDGGGDGMAFSFFNPSGCSFNQGGAGSDAGGGGLGYMNVCLNQKMFTIEFDTYSSKCGGSSPYTFDCNYGGGTSNTSTDDEISLHIDGNALDNGRATSATQVEANAGELEDGNEHTICINYAHSSKTLTVKIDGVTKMTSVFDMAGYFGAGVTLGQAWSAGKENATNIMFVNDGDGTSIFAQNGGTPCPTPSCNKTNTAPITATSDPSATVDAIWGAYPSVGMTHYKWGSGVTASNANLAASYKAMFDANYLYVLIDVTDDYVYSTNPGSFPGTGYGSATNTWDKDGIELYISQTDNKGGSYSSTDYQFVMVYGETTVREGSHNTGCYSKGDVYKYGSGCSSTIPFGATRTANGYRIEVAIPWAAIGSAGVPSNPYLGFDVGVNDDDDGNARKNQLSGNDGTFDEWENPSKFADFSLSTCTLPITLVDFAGVMKNDNALLSWTTSMEVNNKEFLVERSSNGKDWEVIGTVAGAGNSSTLNTYSFTDYSPYNGVNYYKLVQVDFDGKSSTSNIVVLQTGAEGGVVIGPNPFDESFTIRTSIKGTLDISIYDIVGKLVYHANKEVEDGSVIIRPELATGAYVVTVQSGEYVEHQRVIKK